MAALGWLLNLDFAGGAAVADVVGIGVNPRFVVVHRRKRPYGGWMIALRPMFRRLRWI